MNSAYHKSHLPLKLHNSSFKDEKAQPAFGENVLIFNSNKLCKNTQFFQNNKFIIIISKEQSVAFQNGLSVNLPITNLTQLSVSVIDSHGNSQWSPIDRIRCVANIVVEFWVVPVQWFSPRFDSEMVDEMQSAVRSELQTKELTEISWCSASLCLDSNFNKFWEPTACNFSCSTSATIDSATVINSSMILRNSCNSFEGSSMEWVAQS